MNKLFFLLLAVIIIVIATVARLYALPLVAACLALSYFTYARRVQILERVYGERTLLLHRVSVQIIEAAGGPDHIRVSWSMVLPRRRSELYAAFLRVRDCNPSQRVGYAAERVIASLHNPSVNAGVIACMREGGYDYYIMVSSGDKRVLKSAVSEVYRHLYASGVYVEPANPVEALEAVGELRETSFTPTPPRFLLAATSLITASVALSSLGIPPYLAAFILPLLPLIPFELAIMRGSVNFVPKKGCKLRLTAWGADQQSASTTIRALSTLAMVAKPGSFVCASLRPLDSAIVEAKAKAAIEVLEAARAGAARVADELRAARWMVIKRALEDGAAPFGAAILADPELAEEMAKAGLQPESSNLTDMLALFTPIDAQEIYVSPQLAFLSPYTFLKPRTQRTPKAVWLGKGLREDEDVWLELDLLENVHGLVVGPMGSGKSTFARTLALRALQVGITPIVVDPSGEYRRFAERVGFEVADLWDKQMSLDPRYLTYMDLVHAFDHVAPLSTHEMLLLKQAWETGSLWSSRLAKVELVKDYFSRPSISIGELLEYGRPFVLCLGSTASGRYVAMPVEVQRFAFSLLLSQMRNYVVARGISEPQWMLIVDEAHLFARPLQTERESEVATLARMLRKFGLAVVLVTHDWRDVDDAFVRHCGWKLALSHENPQYVQDTAYYMDLTPSEQTWFSRGVRGRAILRRGIAPHNILVRVMPEELAKPEVYEGATGRARA